MKRACVIGWPVEHSRSPLLHGYWLKKHGIDGAYTKEAVAPDAVADFLRSLDVNGFVGCNVTVPHKAAAFAAADEKDASAKAVLAANTLWLSDGKLIAANSRMGSAQSAGFHSWCRRCGACDYIRISQRGCG